MGKTPIQENPGRENSFGSHGGLGTPEIQFKNLMTSEKIDSKITELKGHLKSIKAFLYFQPIISIITYWFIMTIGREAFFFKEIEKLVTVIVSIEIMVTGYMFLIKGRLRRMQKEEMVYEVMED